ncbi:short-chain fatty acid transporter [Spongiimicrobium sp. 3-5]|uniref:short-chain fatty acid transporter n=1 Tax=Spongiimicrobium sp. 3-5 TaxID=3332596 RepID=UPI00397FF9CC
MITKLGEKFTDVFKKNMPDAFVFALILTLFTSVAAFFWVGAEPLKIISSWYEGFWMLLEFGMQMVLLVVTGYSIALSPLVEKGIDKLTLYIKTPRQVYYFVVLIGFLLSMISWGWVIIAAVFARELALRIRGINYPYLIACVYFSSIGWVTGLSSSIPLLLNTEKNYMITGGILSDTISTSYTLGSLLNFGMIILFLVFGPVLMLLLEPKKSEGNQLTDFLALDMAPKPKSIPEEAASFKLPFKAPSDQLNNSVLLQYCIALMGAVYIFYHFATKGPDLNLNIMIFTFVIVGLFLHKTPMRYGISMKRASGNIADILFQYPFYAGIMGIMTFTGLGRELGQLIASVATADTYPFFAYLLGGVVNFAIPSGGGEYAVIGPSVIEAVNNIGAGLSTEELTVMNARASMAIAYGEGLTNLLQPFFLLLLLPVMAKGIKIQARDIMGYLVIPFLLFFVLQITMVLWVPL